MHEDFNVPARHEAYKHLFTMGYREGAILAIGGIPTLLCVFAPWLPESLAFIKIGLGILLGGFTVLWAFGYENESYERFEKRFLAFLTHKSSPRVFLRGYDATASQKTAKPPRAAARPAQPATRPGAITFQPIEIGTMAIIHIFSYALLGTLIAWLYSGGVQEILRLLNTTALP